MIHMDFSEENELYFNSLIRSRVDLTSEEKERIITFGIKTHMETHYSSIYPFDKKPQLKAYFLGEAPDFMDGNLKVQVYQFKDEAGKIWLVPQYKQLREGNGLNSSFKGFKYEPIKEHLYLIHFNGKHEGENSEYYFKFSVAVII